MSELDASPTVQQVPIDTTTPTTPTPVERSTPVEPKDEAPPVEVKKPDLDTAIKNAFEKSQAKNADKDEAKAKEAPEPKADVKVEAKQPAETPEAKAARERAPDGKFAPKEGAKEPSAASAEPADGSGQDGKADARPSEGRDYTKPPARFLPRAKEAWANVPPDVQGEVHRAFENYEKGLGEYKESHENWSKLKEFDQMAKQAGTTVPDYIRNVRAIEQLIATNPAEGIKRVLATANITPEQYARHVLGQAQQQQNPQAAQATQLTQTIQTLTQKLEMMERREQERTQQADEEKRLGEVERKFIEPFKVDHPRYDDLEEDIAFFLNSGKIPSTLSERERLEAAYDMAERINPAPAAFKEPGTPVAAQRPLNPAGQKSVTGSPTPGLATTRAPGKEDAKDLDAILRRSLAKATAR